MSAEDNNVALSDKYELDIVGKLHFMEQQISMRKEESKKARRTSPGISANASDMKKGVQTGPVLKETNFVNLTCQHVQVTLALLILALNQYLVVMPPVLILWIVGAFIVLLIVDLIFRSIDLIMG